MGRKEKVAQRVDSVRNTHFTGRGREHPAIELKPICDGFNGAGGAGGVREEILGACAAFAR
jgi:hypothetical protein